MADKIDRTLVDALRKSLESGINDEALTQLNKQLRNAVDDLEADIVWRLKDELAMQLAGYAEEMASKAVEQMLAGNAEQVRRYLSCEQRGKATWTGRSDGYTGPRDEPQTHHVIHGKLSESGCIELRKRIVDAHADLLKTERILDLEDQIRSLVREVNTQRVRIEALHEQLRDR